MDDNTDLESGKISFFPSVIPPLEAGDYLIKVQHGIQFGSNQSTDSESCQQISVQAPRFRLDASDVHCVSPANNSAGKYDSQLPHIVFNKRTLPWEHKLLYEPGIPWLALLILDEADLIAPPIGAQRTSQLSWSCQLREAVDLSPDTTSSQQLQKPRISHLDYGQTEQDPVEVIQIRKDRLQAILPTKNERRLLAHARQVCMEHRESLSLDHPGWFSVVVANRFPCNPYAPTLQYAHVVSLEGLPEDLVTMASDTVVQLISLYSWSFTCLPDHGESFASFMNNLAPPGSDKKQADLLLRLQSMEPADNEDKDLTTEVKAILNRGYVLLPYHDDKGQDSFCWYRGPLIPFKESPFRSLPEARSFGVADDAMIIHQSSGMFDLAYSVAWQSGRLMALSNRAFAISLMDWRKKVNYLYWLHRNLADHGVIENGQDPDESVLAQIHQKLVSKSFIDYVLKDFMNLLSNPQVTPQHAPVPSEPNNATSSVSKGKEVNKLLYQLAADDAVEISETLARLTLLYDLPFERIVPDPRMLPAESIRFFYLDQAWVDCMIDGALSIGSHGSKDRFHTENTRTIFRDVVGKLVLQYRQSQTGVQKPANGSTPANGSICGFLLRSEVLRQFPGLQIKAYLKLIDNSNAPDANYLLQPLRFDRLSPTVLICIYPVEPVWIEFDEPHENVCFGLVGNDLHLRNTGSDMSHDPNDHKSTIAVDQNFFRKVAEAEPSPGRILKIELLAKSIETSLQMQSGSLTSADLALQLIKTTQKFVFQSSGIKA
jgi:hypothetical protein